MEKTQKFDYVSSVYKSNCLIEVMKAKIHNPHIKIYFCKPSFQNKFLQMPHFMWSDGIFDYDFSDEENNPLPWYQCFWFSGRIRRFRFGFARKYSEMRNRKLVKA